jgi:hypothetical protein
MTERWIKNDVRLLEPSKTRRTCHTRPAHLRPNEREGCHFRVTAVTWGDIGWHAE